MAALFVYPSVVVSSSMICSAVCQQVEPCCVVVSSKQDTRVINALRQIGAGRLNTDMVVSRKSNVFCRNSLVAKGSRLLSMFIGGSFPKFFKSILCFFRRIKLLE